MSSRQPLSISDCTECQKMNPLVVRQALGCGYEPRNDRVRLTMWAPPTGKVGYRGPPPSVCAGYTTSLPEVIEAAITRVHWSKGNLAAIESSEDLENSIVVLEGAYNEVQRWAMTATAEGGGRG